MCGLTYTYIYIVYTTVWKNITLWIDPYFPIVALVSNESVSDVKGVKFMTCGNKFLVFAADIRILDLKTFFYTLHKVILN